jgi:hypothetical protein
MHIHKLKIILIGGNLNAILHSSEKKGSSASKKNNDHF